MNEHQILIDRILILCAQRGISPTALAKASGLSESWLRRILNGKTTRISLVTIVKICDGLKITLTEFFDMPELDPSDRRPPRRDGTAQ